MRVLIILISIDIFLHFHLESNAIDLVVSTIKEGFPLIEYFDEIFGKEFHETATLLLDLHNACEQVTQELKIRNLIIIIFCHYLIVQENEYKHMIIVFTFFKITKYVHIYIVVGDGVGFEQREYQGYRVHFAAFRFF